MASSRTAKRRQVQEVRALPPDRARRAGALDGLTLDGRKVDMVLGARLTGAKLDRTIEGASTISLDVWNGDGAVLASGALGRQIMSRHCRVRIDGLAYNISGVGKSGDQLTLSCEDEIIFDLKRHGKKNPVRAKNVTRPQFCAQLVRQAGKRVTILTPSTPLKKASDKSAKRRKGKSLGRVTVKGQPATAQQKRVAAQVLDSASKIKGARGKPLVALIAAIIVECEMRNVQGAGADAISFGVIQAIPGRTAGPKGTFTKAQALDVDYSTKAALLPPGPTSSGGLIAGAKKYPQESIGQMADRAINGLGVGDPGYVGKVDGRKAEAEAIIRAYDAGLLGGAADEGPSPKSGSFSRNRGESTWACCTRLLQEIGWRIFVREGEVIIAAEPALYRAPASLTLDRDTDFWDPDFEWARGLSVNEMSGRIAAGRYAVDPGETVQVADFSQLEQKWLIASTSVDLLSGDAPVELQLRMPQKPQAEQTQAAPTARAASETGDLRARIVAEAKKSLTSKTGFSRYSQAGALTGNPNPPAPARTDCSQWVRAIYLRAGAKDPGTWTGEQYARSKATSRPKPGDLVLYPKGSGSRHVELYVGSGKTIGHGSPPIDYSTPAGPGADYEFRTFDWLDD